MQLRPQTFSLQAAATVLGITRPVLVRALEKLGAITHDDFGISTTPAFKDSDYFRMEARGAYMHTNRLRHYHVTLVTVQGLAWIEKQLTLARAS